MKQYPHRYEKWIFSLLISVLSIILFSSCSDHKLIYFCYNTYGEPTKVYSSADTSAPVVAELPSPSYQVTLADRRYDRGSQFTRITTSDGVAGYVETKYVRYEHQYGKMLRSRSGEELWVRDRYAYEKVGEAGSPMVSGLLRFMLDITFYKYDFDESSCTILLIVFGFIMLLINCVGWLDLEIGEVAYWILNILYWGLYLAILVTEFIVFCMHSPFDAWSTGEQLIEAHVIIEIIIGLIAFLLLGYSVVFSIAGTPNMLGSLLPQGLGDHSGYDIVLKNMIISFLFIIVGTICIWLFPGFVDKILYAWLILEGLLSAALLVSALLEGSFGGFIGTLIYSVVFPAVIFIIMNTAATMGVMVMILACIVVVPLSAFLTPTSPSPTGFVLRNSDGDIVDEIDTLGNSKHFDRSYSRGIGGWYRNN